MTSNIFDDLGLNLDFEFLSAETEADISSLVLKNESKKRKFFKIENEMAQLGAIIKRLPNKDEVFKMLSFRGGFSSVGIITYICEFEKINRLYVSTFRIGLKQFEILNSLYNSDKIESAVFLTSSMQRKNGIDYDYYMPIFNGCKQNGWDMIEVKNHSKLILAETDKNFYVVETSSNLNENPKIEQFSFENDERLFKWCEDFFRAVIKLKKKC